MLCIYVNARKGYRKNIQLAMHYYAIAADKGIPEAAFVIGQCFLLDGDKSKALKSLQQACDGGYLPAKTLIEQNNLFSN